MTEQLQKPNPLLDPIPGIAWQNRIMIDRGARRIIRAAGKGRRLPAWVAAKAALYIRTSSNNYFYSIPPNKHQL